MGGGKRTVLRNEGRRSPCINLYRTEAERGDVIGYCREQTWRNIYANNIRLFEESSGLGTKDINNPSGY
jgi:hypothetical protein